MWAEIIILIAILKTPPPSVDAPVSPAVVSFLMMFLIQNTQ
jgi:low affinity Fe/Cu permease